MLAQKYSAQSTKRDMANEEPTGKNRRTFGGVVSSAVTSLPPGQGIHNRNSIRSLSQLLQQENMMSHAVSANNPNLDILFPCTWDACYSR
jgi:hypothetical protein